MLPEPVMRFALAIAAGAAAALAPAADPAQVPYPQGDRQWTHVKSMQILPGHPLHDAFGYAGTGGWGFQA